MAPIKLIVLIEFYLQSNLKLSLWVVHIEPITLKSLSSSFDPISVALFVCFDIGASFYREQWSIAPVCSAQIFGVRLLQMLQQCSELAKCCQICCRRPKNLFCTSSKISKALSPKNSISLFCSALPCGLVWVVSYYDDHEWWSWVG